MRWSAAPAMTALGALVLTVDVPVHPKRERNLRNGFARVRSGGVLEALKLKPSIILEAMTHPAWVYRICHGSAARRPSAIGRRMPATARARQTSSSSAAARPRRRRRPGATSNAIAASFPRTLIVKGILNPADAVRAAEIGVDGIIVSNHGGRQLDQAPASLEALPAIKAAVGDKLTVMLDSGVRRGADILIAFCLGAQFVFFGRPTLYGAVAGGLPGVKKAIDIFRGEIDLVMGQIGCPSLDQLGPDFLWRDDWMQNR